MIAFPQANPTINSSVFFKALNRIVIALSVPIILSKYFHSETGKCYSVGLWTKLKLMVKMIRNRQQILTCSHFLEHLIIATQILEVSPDVEGCVVECGSFKGGSATNLSLVCELCHRQLEVFDSFKGLPKPMDVDRQHTLLSINEIHTYAKGAWRGTLEEVKANISRYGKIGVCNFNVGYFDETMPSFQKKCICVFLDVDLTSSLETCLRYLWPQLQDGCYVFTHEAPHTEIAAAFFDQDWWRSQMNSKAPGLVGAGNGLGLLPANGGFRSDLGFTVKNSQHLGFKINPQTGITRDDEIRSKAIGQSFK